MPGGPLASWFLAGSTDSYLVNQWYTKTVDYWATRSERHHYFWFHYQFKDIYNDDPMFKIAWDKIRKISADAPHHFIPYHEKFRRYLNENDKKIIDFPSTPVFKLTHKYDPSTITKSSVLTYILNPTAYSNVSIYSRIFDFLKSVKKNIHKISSRS